MHQGDIIQERYELIEPLGEGGMAVVWRARDTRLERMVALKLIAPRFADDPEFLVRFFSEAQSVARITHANVVSVLDFGDADARPFLVMEFIEGGSVSELAGEPLLPERAAEIVTQAARGASGAHRLGIVHRDIKPANILLTDEGRAKLADFGIASSLGAEDLTASGAAIGSPHYISPEQASAAEVTPASDVYSLGAVLFELVTGRHVFEGDNVMAVAMAHVERTPQPPSALVADLGAALEAVILRCLAKDPARRFRDGDALADALDSALDGRAAIASTPPGPGGARRRRLSRPLTIGAAVALALVVALGAWAMSSGRQEPVAQATTDLPKVTFDGADRRRSPSPTPSEPSSSGAAPAATPTATPDASPTPAPQEPDDPSPAPEPSEEPEPSPEPSLSPTPSVSPTPEPTPESTPEQEGAPATSAVRVPTGGSRPGGGATS
ncbi:MAG: serine/threonine-protein kinase [Actinomycetota bacterium]